MLIALILSTIDPPSSGFATQAVAGQTIVNDGESGVERAVDRMVGGIISYVQWPGSDADTPRTMCTVGRPRLSERMVPAVSGRRRVNVRTATPAHVLATRDCDILFLGQMPDADRQRLIGWVRGRAVLTITDDDPDCGDGAMFCLSGRATSLSFAVNLDSVTRGTVRVDPRVLKIGRANGGAR